MLELIKSLLHQMVFQWRRRSSSAYIKWLRGRGILIGERCLFRFPIYTNIDVSRPSLVSIGDNVDFNKYFSLMTHDYASLVFRERFSDFANSSGKVRIGNNVYFGTNIVVLKGVEIGDNCIIGAGSVVTHDVPSNSVACGVPARVICSVDDLYKKRKDEGLNMAFEYVQSIKERFHRNPLQSELFEEFIYFSEHDEAIAHWQLMHKYDEWRSQHEFAYKKLDDFLQAAKSNADDKC